MRHRLTEKDRPTAVPHLVGRTSTDAYDTALDAGLLAVDYDPSHTAHTSGTVIAQKPRPGTRLPVGDIVQIWLDPGPGDGGGGSEPPKHPTPPLPTGEKVPG